MPELLPVKFANLPRPCDIFAGIRPFATIFLVATLEKESWVFLYTNLLHDHAQTINYLVTRVDFTFECNSTCFVIADYCS